MRNPSLVLEKMIEYCDNVDFKKKLENLYDEISLFAPEQYNEAYRLIYDILYSYAGPNYVYVTSTDENLLKMAVIFTQQHISVLNKDGIFYPRTFKKALTLEMIASYERLRIKDLYI